MIVLENGKIRIKFDDRGRITSFTDLAGKNVELIDSPAHASFFMNLASKDCKEILVFEEDQEIKCSVKDGTAVFEIDRLVTDPGRVSGKTAEDISLKLCAWLDDDCVMFRADIDNRTDLMILDFEYPIAGVIKSLGSGVPSLYLPIQPGYLIANIGKRLSSSEEERETGTNAMSFAYPGESMVSTFGILDRETCLFVTSEDPEFIACQFKVKGSATDYGALTLSVDKHLCSRRGKISAPPVRIRLYMGTWHRAAGEYAGWVSQFRPERRIPDWIRNMSGMFLVIMKQQFGYEMWDYSSLPRLYEYAKEQGYDTLALFGWFHTGHDNNYPDLTASPTLGGEKSLRENIKKVQKAGGRVVLYLQGHLIDPASDFYENGIGKDVELRNIWGKPYIEFWSKSHRSNFLAAFSRKPFMLACPSCPEWVDLMRENAHWVASFGADGVLYDQIGGLSPYVCFNSDHPHAGGNPARAMSCGQRELVRALQDEARKISDDFVFMSENFTDIYSPFIDAIHGCPNSSGSFDVKPGDEDGATSFPDFMKFAFPHSVYTGRDSNSYGRVRFINHTFLYGYPAEMEIRYRADCIDLENDKYHDERVHSKEVLELKKKYQKYFTDGTYTDILDFENRDPGFPARGFVLGDELAVTLWNDSDRPRIPDISVPGKKLASFETVSGGPSDRVSEVAPQQVAICIFR